MHIGVRGPADRMGQNEDTCQSLWQSERFARTRWFAFYNTAYGVEWVGLFDTGFQVHVQLTRHLVNILT